MELVCLEMVFLAIHRCDQWLHFSWLHCQQYRKLTQFVVKHRQQNQIVRQQPLCESRVCDCRGLKVKEIDLLLEAMIVTGMSLALVAGSQSFWNHATCVEDLSGRAVCRIRTPYDSTVGSIRNIPR